MNAERERQRLLNEYNGKRIIGYAARHGASIRHGKGDHDIICYHGHSMPCPNRTLGHGLQCKIVRWIITVGLAALALAALLAAV